MKSRNLAITTIILFAAIVIFNFSIANADILVYDNNNQYLGILMDLSGEDFDIFVPSINARYGEDYEDPVDACPGDAYFELSNCSSTPYEQNPLPSIQNLSGSILGGYYVVDYNQQKTFAPLSYIDSDCVCQDAVSWPSKKYYKLIEVQMPFTTPVALPLRFEVRNRAVVIPLN